MVLQPRRLLLDNLLRFTKKAGRFHDQPFFISIPTTYNSDVKKITGLYSTLNYLRVECNPVSYYFLLLLFPGSKFLLCQFKTFLNHLECIFNIIIEPNRKTHQTFGKAHFLLHIFRNFT